MGEPREIRPMRPERRREEAIDALQMLADSLVANGERAVGLVTVGEIRDFAALLKGERR